MAPFDSAVELRPSGQKSLSTTFPQRQGSATSVAANPNEYLCGRVGYHTSCRIFWGTLCMYIH